MGHDDFCNWQRAEVTQFYELGKQREMHSCGTLALTIGSSQRFLFQYRKVEGLINQLMRHGNVFRPLIALELLIILQEKQK